MDRRWPRRRRAALGVKRAIDVVGAIAGIIILSPVLGWAALTVRLVDGAPILFRQRRPGLHERTFTIRKFRTMRPPRPGEDPYADDHLRVTRLGRRLRSTSIDELPELWNVLRGEMSLVGPRPLLVEYLVAYTPDERRRHLMRPGITGWAAVNGRHAVGFEERFVLDLWYVDNWSLSLDLRILAMTIRQVFQRTGVWATQDPTDIGVPARFRDAVAAAASPDMAD